MMGNGNMNTHLSFGPQFTMPSIMTDTEEVMHIFHIDWLGDDISFESNFMDVMSALETVLQHVWDYENMFGAASVATFFKALYRMDIIEQYPQMREYGWSCDSLSDCCCNWIPFLIQKRKNAYNEFDILTYIYPNDNLREVLEDYGAIIPDEVFYDL